MVPAFFGSFFDLILKDRHGKGPTTGATALRDHRQPESMPPPTWMDARGRNQMDGRKNIYYFRKNSESTRSSLSPPPSRLARTFFVDIDVSPSSGHSSPFSLFLCDLISMEEGQGSNATTH